MNLFGMNGPGVKRNPLAALMQPNLMEMLQPEGGDEQHKGPTPEQAAILRQFALNNQPVLPDEGNAPSHSPVMRQAAQGAPPPTGFRDVNPRLGPPPMAGAKSPPEFMGKLSENAGPLGWRAATVGLSPIGSIGLVGKKLYDMATEDPKSTPSTAPISSSPSQQPQQEPFDEAGALTALDSQKEAGADMAMGGGLLGPAIAATQELLQKHGQMANTMEGAKAALKREFQDTPELDQIIAATQQELAQTKANRKQPGIGEFLTMALLNLSGMNPRQSADLVLGLSNQKGDEMRLEDRLAQLEGSRAGAKMHGRQQLRGMEQQEKYQALQNALRQQEMGRKQRNDDREFGFKNQKLSLDKLMQELGQVRQQVGLETDPTKKKKLQDLIDRLDFFQKGQPAQPPRDERQSRMFGDMIGGGGYA